MSDLQTPNRVSIDPTQEPSPTQIFDALSNERRQHALEHLSNYGIVSVDDLATRLASREKNTSTDHRTQITTGLIHNHLPKLEKIGIIEYDASNTTVELLVEPADLAPYLRLATGRDSGDGGR